MLLIGHEHVMRIPEFHLSWGLVLVGILLIYIGLCCTKAVKAHAVAYTMFP